MKNLNIVALQDMTIAELGNMAKNFGLGGYSGLRKQDLISLIVDAKANRNNTITAVLIGALHRCDVQTAKALQAQINFLML